MSADGSRVLPDTDAPNRAQMVPMKRMALWAATAAPGFLVTLALASLAGFVAIAGTLLVYDARGGIGPLGWVNDSILPMISRVCFIVAPVTYAVATWRLGVLGAVAAFLGVMFFGPLLWSMSPWDSVDSSARYGYYDEGRGWVALFRYLESFVSFVIVVPATFVVRWIWRSFRTRTKSSTLT